MTSWMVLSCTAVNSYEPMRLAGTWKQYSKNAISQLTKMTLNSGVWRYFRWPYQANVMKMFEMVSSSRVVISEILVENRALLPALLQRGQRAPTRCRRFDCYRVERTSSRTGVARAEVQRLSRRTFSPTIAWPRQTTP